MNISAIIFLVVGFSAIIGGFILEGGAPSGLLSPTAIVIILGGTIGAVGISFPKSELVRIPKIFKFLFSDQQFDMVADLDKLKKMCVKVRQTGLLSLENQIENESDSLMRKGMRLIVDGTSPAYTREALDLSLEVIDARHHAGAAMIEAAGGYSPTMGIIGTVMGLVLVLSDLNDPETLGPKIAMAFIATLYGVGLANLFWLPLATHLKQKNRLEMLHKSMIIEGLILIQEGVNTNYMDEKLSSFIADAQLETKGSEKKANKKKKKKG